MKEWNFGDSFPSIEIDTEHWQTLTGLEKLQYLKRLVFQEKDFGNRINLINFILGNTAKIGRSVIKNPDHREYFDILENAANLISVSAAIGNVAKAKQTHKSTKNNEIAKLMGLPNGNYVSETKLDITTAMADAFVDMSEFHKNKYAIVVENLNVDDGKKQQGEDQLQSFASKTIKITGTIQGENKWGLIIKSSGVLFDEDEDTTGSCITRLYYPASGMKLHPDALKETLQKIMYALYIDKVDTRKNFVKIKGTKLEICERKEIDIKITNINVPRVVRCIRKVLTEKSRRGMIFIGEPGVGKTICVHKVTNEFRDTLIFWVSPDSINTVTGIRNVFKIFKMFENCIVIFDDLDSGPFTGKDEVTGEFIAHLDGTNNDDLKCVIIGTVNDPSKLHASLINRPERIDDVIHVKNPQTNEEIASIVFGKAKKKGYVTKEEYDAFKLKGEDSDTIIGYLDFNEKDKKFIDICKMILKAQFTQAQVAALITDCHCYAENNMITLELMNEIMNARLDSITNSNKVARKGKLADDPNNLSDEAYGNLSKKSTRVSHAI